MRLRRSKPISFDLLRLHYFYIFFIFIVIYFFSARVKYMLDVLPAIKNNNMSKIPNYDTSYSEHLKKLMKGFIRKGNYVTQLNISLDDLLKAEERGKWWVVGSAWTGVIENNQSSDGSKKSDKFSQKLLKLAKSQRMNTDTRKNIFCILMSSEVSIIIIFLTHLIFMN